MAQVRLVITAISVGVLIGAGTVLFLQNKAVTADTMSGGVTGQASVIDGDTLEIHGQRIRMDMIDAPESAQLCKDAAGKDYRCGQAASFALADKIGRHVVTCTDRGKDRYGRILGVCSANGIELNAWMVEQGYAVEYRRYSHGEYRLAEENAKAARRGLWAGSFEWPWDWRRNNRK